MKDAYNWYEEQHHGLGVEFMQAIEFRLEAIAERPKQFPAVRSLIRRAIVGRFPYAIFFIDGEQFISVVAVLHHARDPKHWQSRNDN